MGAGQGFIDGDDVTDLDELTVNFDNLMWAVRYSLRRICVVLTMIIKRSF